MPISKRELVTPHLNGLASALKAHERKSHLLCLCSEGWWVGVLGWEWWGSTLSLGERGFLEAA